jgi:hypothetical protein
MKHILYVSNYKRGDGAKLCCYLRHVKLISLTVIMLHHVVKVKIELLYHRLYTT